MVIDDPLAPVFERGGTEVDEKPQREIQEPKVGQDLLGMNRQKIFNRLQLDQETVFDDEVSPKPLVECHAHELDLHGCLTLDRHSSIYQHLREHDFIHGFQ